MMEQKNKDLIIITKDINSKHSSMYSQWSW